MRGGHRRIGSERTARGLATHLTVTNLDRPELRSEFKLNSATEAAAGVARYDFEGAHCDEAYGRSSAATRGAISPRPHHPNETLAWPGAGALWAATRCGTALGGKVLTTSVTIRCAKRKVATVGPRLVHRADD